MSVEDCFPDSTLTALQCDLSAVEEQLEIYTQQLSHNSSVDKSEIEALIDKNDSCNRNCDLRSFDPKVVFNMHYVPINATPCNSQLLNNLIPPSIDPQLILPAAIFPEKIPTPLEHQLILPPEIFPEVLKIKSEKLTTQNNSENSSVKLVENKPNNASPKFMKIKLENVSSPNTSKLSYYPSDSLTEIKSPNITSPNKIILEMKRNGSVIYKRRKFLKMKTDNRTTKAMEILQQYNNNTNNLLSEKNNENANINVAANKCTTAKSWVSLLTNKVVINKSEEYHIRNDHNYGIDPRRQDVPTPYPSDSGTYYVLINYYIYLLYYYIFFILIS